MRLLLSMLPVAIASAFPAWGQEISVDPIIFSSRDGKTEVKGYLFKSEDMPTKAPAIVMMHGRSGAYSSSADGRFDASTLSARHKAWGKLLAKSGYIVLMVDDFGAMGYPEGFKAGTYADRPPEIDEVIYRPLHAYGALRYLQQRSDVQSDRVALLGWSNGGSATLAAMADDKPGDMTKIGFRSGVSIYPGCGLKRRFDKQGYKPYNPVRVFIGTADEEVSPALCENLVRRSQARGGDITLTVFEGATHSYDTPTKSRQSLAANAEAKATTEKLVLDFLSRSLN